MINRERLAELHSTFLRDGGDLTDQQIGDMLDTLSALLTVKEAAEGVAWFVDTLDDNCDASNEDEASYIEQKKAFKKALAAVKEGA